MNRKNVRAELALPSYRHSVTAPFSIAYTRALAICACQRRLVVSAVVFILLQFFFLRIAPRRLLPRRGLSIYYPAGPVVLRYVVAPQHCDDTLRLVCKSTKKNVNTQTVLQECVYILLFFNVSRPLDHVSELILHTEARTRFLAVILFMAVHSTAVEDQQLPDELFQRALLCRRARICIVSFLIPAANIHDPDGVRIVPYAMCARLAYRASSLDGSVQMHDVVVPTPLEATLAVPRVQIGLRHLPPGRRVGAV